VSAAASRTAALLRFALNQTRDPVLPGDENARWRLVVCDGVVQTRMAILQSGVTVDPVRSGLIACAVVRRYAGYAMRGVV
jgi:hypothetical protein